MNDVLQKQFFLNGYFTKRKNLIIWEKIMKIKC